MSMGLGMLILNVRFVWLFSMVCVCCFDLVVKLCEVFGGVYVDVYVGVIYWDGLGCVVGYDVFGVFVVL